MTRSPADRDPPKAGRQGHRARTGLSLFEKLGSYFAEKLVGGLGHGAVMTFPDRPYLKWSFEYEYPEKVRVTRDNPKTFNEGCKALHKMFRTFLEHYPEFSDNSGNDYDVISDLVNDVICTQAKCEGRIDAWQNAAKSGGLFNLSNEKIEVYDADQQHTNREDLIKIKDSRKITEFSIFRFYQAAAAHRHYVIRDLLPSHNLIVD